MELTNEVLDGLIALWTGDRGPKLKELAKLVSCERDDLEDEIAMRVRARLAFVEPRQLQGGSEYGGAVK